MTDLDDVTPTGIDGLDAILGGGVSTGALVFIVGPPGAGKTILGSQLVFTAARRGGKALILSAYSEGHAKLLQHLRPLSFFTPELVGESVQLLTLHNLISDDPLASATALVQTIRSSGASMVLLDGFQGVATLDVTPDSIRRLLAALATQLPYVGATVFVTLAGDARDLHLNPVLTAVDTVIGLIYGAQNMNHVRYAEIVKQRGRAQLAGRHRFRVTSDGIIVFPRLESHPTPVSNPRPRGRAAFGLPGLDALMGGGPTAGTTTLLAGPPGTGKTTLALRWLLEDARPDAIGVFVSFRENVAQLTLKADAFGLPIREAIEAGALQVVRVPAVDLVPDEISTQLLDLFRRHTVRRLVIDDLAFLLRSLGERAYDFLAALAEHFYGEGVTVLSTLEITPFAGLRVDLSNAPIEMLAENLIVLQEHEQGPDIQRTLAVLRMRFSDYEHQLRTLRLNAQGIQVLNASLPPNA